MKNLINSSGDEVTTSLDASYYKGCGSVYGAEREVVCYQRER